MTFTISKLPLSMYSPVHTKIRLWKEHLNLIGKCAPPDIHRPLWPNTFVRVKYVLTTIRHKKPSAARTALNYNPCT